MANVDKAGKATSFNLDRLKEMRDDITVHRLGAADLDTFVAQRREDGAGGVTLSGDLNDNLANEGRARLTTARLSTRSRERARTALPAELAAVLAYLYGNSRQTIPVADITHFAGCSAMRLSEITRLCIKDISWNRKSLLVRQREE